VLVKCGIRSAGQRSRIALRRKGSSTGGILLRRSWLLEAERLELVGRPAKRSSSFSGSPFFGAAGLLLLLVAGMRLAFSPPTCGVIQTRCFGCW
jgi:hypothetical protein